jgi:hypothetical protein
MTNLMSSLLMTPFVELPTVNTCCPFRMQMFIFTLLLLHFPFLPNFVTQNFLATGGMQVQLYFYIPSVPVWHVIGQTLPYFTLFCLSIFLHLVVNRNTIRRNWYLHRCVQAVEQYFICRIQHVILQGRHIKLISHWRSFQCVVTLRNKKWNMCILFKFRD